VIAASIDFETYSTVELKRTGIYPYARHSDTGIWCMAWRIEGDPEVSLWHPGQPFPERLKQHLDAGGVLRAWNAAFERVMWKMCAARKYAFPAVSDDRFYCTMAEAQAMALPRALDHAATVLRLPVKKDMDGKKLMIKLCRPRRFDDAGEPVWWASETNAVDPLLVRLYDYCKGDVRVEEAVQPMVNPLSSQEREVYLLTQAMNDRGVHLDIELVMSAQVVAQNEIDKQNAILAEATGGEVTEITKVAKLKQWLASTQGLVNEKGDPLESLDKAALRDLLADTGSLTGPAVVALQARQEAAKSSLKKIEAMLDCVDIDSRMKGLLLYHAASTGRWSGQLAQPHNFPRGNDVDLKDGKLEAYIAQVMKWEPTPLKVLAAMLRSMITAKPGYELLCSDFAAIEARVLAWLAEQDDLVAAFASNAPIYKIMAAKVYGVQVSDIVKPSDQYTLGKSLILGCGYQMGAPKFVTSSKDQYGLIVAPELAADAVQTYRATNTKIVSFWSELNRCALNAVASPGETFYTRGKRVRFIRRGGYLWAKLPSGRALAYASPKIVDRPVPWAKKPETAEELKNWKPETRPAVEFSGVNGYTRKWERMALYGGLLAENVVQAVSRDLLAEACLRAEAAGYPALLNVHDELVSERAVGEGSLEEFEKLMQTTPEWAAGLPVACESWRGFRYRK